MKKTTTHFLILIGLLSSCTTKEKAIDTENLFSNLEAFAEEKWYTNLYDLKAKVDYSDQQDVIQFDVQAELVDENQAAPNDGALSYELSYLIAEESVTIKCKKTNTGKMKQPVSLVLPLISPTGESVEQPSSSIIQIKKPEGLVVIEANVPLQIKQTNKERAFNMVPGMEAVPIIAAFNESDSEPIICTIKVI